MVNLRKDAHGAGSMDGVNLVVIAYNNRKASKDGVVTTHYLDARVHPGDRRAVGQTNLALVSKKDPKAPNGFNNSARYSVGQFEAIKAAAGENKTDLTNKDGEVVGQIYGVKANLLISGGELIANTKTVEPTDLSVKPNAAGVDIRTQMFASMKAVKDARDAERTAAAQAVAPAAAVEEPTAAAVEEPKAEAKPKTATKRTTAARKPATKKTAAPKELVGAGAPTPEPVDDQPGLG